MGVARQIPLRARDGSIRAYALVDDEDYEDVSRWRWCLTSRGYVQRREYLGKTAGKYCYRHVLLHQYLTGRRGVDHENGDPLDNRRENLRPATQAQNSQNRRVNRGAASGIRGVSRAGRGWKATVQVDGVSHYLGYSLDAEALRERVEAFRAEHMPFSADARAA